MAFEITDSPRADLIFSFDSPSPPLLFDDPATHGMHDRMKKVDFIVELPGETWLIEVKDPESRLIPLLKTASAKTSFWKRMSSGTLYRRELAPKLKDTLSYLVLANRAPAHEIRYVVFIGLSKLDAAMLLTAQRKLRQVCFHPGPHGNDWPSKFDVIVFNMAAWNKHLHPHSVRRP